MARPKRDPKTGKDAKSSRKTSTKEKDQRRSSSRTKNQDGSIKKLLPNKLNGILYDQWRRNEPIDWSDYDKFDTSALKKKIALAQEAAQGVEPESKENSTDPSSKTAETPKETSAGDGKPEEPSSSESSPSSSSESSESSESGQEPNNNDQVQEMDVDQISLGDLEAYGFGDAPEEQLAEEEQNEEPEEDEQIPVIQHETADTMSLYHEAIMVRVPQIVDRSKFNDNFTVLTRTEVVRSNNVFKTPADNLFFNSEPGNMFAQTLCARISDLYAEETADGTRMSVGDIVDRVLKAQHYSLMELHPLMFQYKEAPMRFPKIMRAFMKGFCEGELFTSDGKSLNFARPMVFIADLFARFRLGIVTNDFNEWEALYVACIEVTNRCCNIPVGKAKNDRVTANSDLEYGEMAIPMALAGFHMKGRGVTMTATNRGTVYSYGQGSTKSQDEKTRVLKFRHYTSWGDNDENTQDALRGLIIRDPRNYDRPTWATTDFGITKRELFAMTGMKEQVILVPRVALQQDPKTKQTKKVLVKHRDEPNTNRSTPFAP